MTDYQINYSIETGELKLSFWKTIKHYGIVFFLFSIPIMLMLFSLLFSYLKDYIEGTPKHIREVEYWIIIIPIILGILFYRLQKKRLEFKTIETQLTRKQLEKIINRVANELEWIPYMATENAILAKTRPAFLSGSWGEHITILFDGNKILVNSICDLDMRVSVVSMGRNKKNMNRLIEEIKKASR